MKNAKKVATVGKASEDDKSTDKFGADFKSFYIFPDEFLCLVCNARNRHASLSRYTRPNFDLRKTYKSNICDNVQYYLYNDSVSELKADPFPVNRLREQL